MQFGQCFRAAYSSIANYVAVFNFESLSFAVIENAFDSIMDPSCVTQSWISGFQLNYGLSLELNHRIIDPSTKHGAGENFHCVVSA